MLTQEDAIPVIDYSLLTSGTPNQQSKAIQDLGKACEEWGFFLLVNHGVSETLIDKVFDASSQFFNLTEEEKREFEGKNTFDPITCGTSFRNARLGKILLWRDYLKVIAHPEFHFPDKPQAFSELSLEYCEKTRKVARELLRGIRKSLGLEESDMDSALNLNSDHGLVTLVLQNGVNGLEVQHNGKWVSVDALLNSFMVNTSDQLESTVKDLSSATGDAYMRSELEALGGGKKMPEPRSYDRTREAWQVDNFFWHLERYFKAIDIDEENVQRTVTSQVELIFNRLDDLEVDSRLTVLERKVDVFAKELYDLIKERVTHFTKWEVQ
ncbi:hypothetical protein RJ639_010749 [Escallonia herrerae]|uniref:Non-haem dioxygenase N-terminal domain-containing protein n=1 Tax=Escallonia herrerae TaxID=1293975 RepID=A0AA88VKD0_9ASTE|nr:hypothetical protein RJ639_010749 [Escallonia herrerae]